MADPITDPKNEVNDKVTFLDKAIAGLSNLTRLEVNTLVGAYTFYKTGNMNTSIEVVKLKNLVDTEYKDTIELATEDYNPFA